MEWLIGRARGRSSGVAAAAAAAEKEAASGSLSTDKDAKPYLEEKHTRDQLCMDISMERLLYCPSGLDSNEWVATHVIALYDNVTTLFEALYELCTCSSMSAPGGTVFLAPDERSKKSRCSARQYTESVLVQSQDLLNSFPRHHGQTFSAEFRAAAAVISRHLLHIMAHFYAGHFLDIVRLELVSHLNTVMLHFFLFNVKYHLVEEKELEVLTDLQEALLCHFVATASAADVAGECSSSSHQHAAEAGGAIASAAAAVSSD